MYKVHFFSLREVSLKDKFDKISEDFLIVHMELCRNTIRLNNKTKFNKSFFFKINISEYIDLSILETILEKQIKIIRFSYF